jgi:hypothetical protein
MYRAGDHVYPADLPRRFLCRVSEVEAFRLPTGDRQLLRLVPLEGPWPPGTILIRPDKAVRPAGIPREADRMRRPAARRPNAAPGSQGAAA